MAGQSVVLRLTGDLDVSRGDLLAGTDSPPAPRRRALSATVCWLAERDLTVGARVLVQHGTAVTKAIVRGITTSSTSTATSTCRGGWPATR